MGEAPEILSSGAAARLLGVSQQTVLTWVKAGTLPAQRCPLGFLLPRVDVERLAAQRAARRGEQAS